MVDLEKLQSDLTQNGRWRFGLDGSAYQKYEDASGVRQGAVFLFLPEFVNFVVWRGVVGDFYTDLTCIPTLQHCLNSGKKNIGIYVVTNPASNSQATVSRVEKLLNDMAAALGSNFRMPLLIADIEIHTTYKWVKVLGKWTKKVDKKFTPSQINYSAQEVLLGLDKLQGRITPYYSYASFVYEHMAGMVAGGEPAYLNDRPFWVAHYRANAADSIAAEQPSSYYMKRFRMYDEDAPLFGAAIWQFSADNNTLGEVFNGDAQGFDVNRTHMTSAEIDAFFGNTSLPEPPEPPEQPGAGYEEGYAAGLAEGKRTTKEDAKAAIDKLYT